LAKYLEGEKRHYRDTVYFEYPKPDKPEPIREIVTFALLNTDTNGTVYKKIQWSDKL
jgi:hypothetical protein